MRLFVSRCYRNVTLAAEFLLSCHSSGVKQEIETRRKTIRDLQRVAMEPVTQRDLNTIESEIDEATAQINRLVEKRMVKGNPAKDKLAMFRQQVRLNVIIAVPLR